MKAAEIINRIAYRMAQSPEHGPTLDIGLDVDYACFAIWEGALGRKDEIIADLAANFDIIANYEVHWSPEHHHTNIDRLYERPHGFGHRRGWDTKIGKPPFQMILVRDNSPTYTWKRSVSGIIEPSNEKVVAAKYRYRDLFEKRYQVHSSNNIEEFLFQSAVLLGPKLLNEALDAPTATERELRKDLEGADGWESWHQLFEVLNIGSRYLVQRNFDSLPDRFDDADIDFQCDNYQRLASLCGIIQKPRQLYKENIVVGGKEFSVDIRFVGDHYYPDVWQAEMMRNRRNEHGFFVLTPDDLFFSLLYHAKVQKPQVKDAYRTRLQELAETLRFDWFDAALLDDDEACGRMLSGFLQAKRLHYIRPIDSGVHENMRVIAHLPLAPTPPPRPNTARRILRLLKSPRAAAAAVRRRLPFRA